MSLQAAKRFYHCRDQGELIQAAKDVTSPPLTMYCLPSQLTASTDNSADSARGHCCKLIDKGVNTGRAIENIYLSTPLKALFFQHR